jgi:carboxymethylenebutenolidase
MRQFVLILGLLFSPWFVVGAAAAEGGQMVTLKSAMGTELQGYVAGPEDAGRAILLLHDRWGLNDTVRQWADRFAAKGYRVLAIDVFDGRASNKMALATEIMASVDPEWIKQDVLAGLKYLAAPRRVIATVGAGLGGWQSFQAALLAPEKVAATVVLYGEMKAAPAEVEKIRAPILAIFAKNDPQITAVAMQEYIAALRRPQSPHRFITVDAGRGFIDPLYPDYNQGQADESWGQIERFLDSNMGDV